jgi:hypothetical protein
MTIRETLAGMIRDLMREMVEVQDDPDISPALKRDLGLAISDLGSAQAVIAIDDAGPTQADIAGEVVHVPAPF